jgi:hypothetical protein
MDIETERAHGRRLYRAGKPVEACRNRAQTDGWYAEELSGALAYLRCCEEGGLPAVQVIKEVERV